MWFLALLTILFFMVVSLLLYFRVKIFLLRKTTARKAALNIFNSLRENYPETRERVPVSPDDFPGLDRQFYEEKQRAFTTLGYRFVVDIEDRTATRKNPQRRTLIRVMTSTDASNCVSIFTTAADDQTPPVVTMEISTEFQDQTFVITTVAPNSGMSGPPQITLYYCDPELSAEALVDRHRQHVAEYQSSHSVAAIRRETVDDLLASMAREIRLKHLFRQALGFGWTETEKAFFTQGHDPALMKALVKELDKLAAKTRH